MTVSIPPNELLYEALANPAGMTVHFAAPYAMTNYRMALYRARLKYPEARDLVTRRISNTTLWVGIPAEKSSGIVEIKPGRETCEVEPTQEG